MDFQNSTMEETLKLCEALAFRLPEAMAHAFDAMADFSAAGMQLWWRAFYAPAGGFFNAMWPQRPGAGEVDSLAMEIEQIRAELRSATSERRESEGSVAARFDHLRDEMTTLRDQLNAAAARKKGEGAELAQVQAELNAMRQELRAAMAERENAPVASAAALAEVQSELRALRDRMQSQPASGHLPEQPRGGRQNTEETPRKRPRR